MKPGRELDALVAEKVMGLSLRGPRPADPLTFPIRPGSVYYDIPAEEPEPYSTDIAAAWEVVEKLRKFPAHYVGFELSDRTTENLCPEEDGHYYAGFCLGNGYRPVAGETAPHAICLAALVAIKS